MLSSRITLLSLKYIYNISKINKVILNSYYNYFYFSYFPLYMLMFWNFFFPKFLCHGGLFLFIIIHINLFNRSKKFKKNVKNRKMESAYNEPSTYNKENNQTTFAFFSFSFSVLSLRSFHPMPARTTHFAVSFCSLFLSCTSSYLSSTPHTRTLTTER